jgi:LacI family transcriptional regulator
VFDRVIDSIPCTKIKTNDYTAISEATSNLIGSKRNQIILVSAINNLNVGKQRTKGYQKAMEHAGLSSVVLEANLDQIENVLKDYAENNAFDGCEFRS